MMNVHLPVFLPAALAFAAILPAQQLTLSPVVAAPGQVVTVSLLNNTGGFLAAPLSCESTVMFHSGELASALFVPGQPCDAIWGLSPGQTQVWQILAPDAPGSYVVTFDPMFGLRAVARLDVNVPTPNAQQLTFFPKGIHFPQSAHQMDYSDPSSRPWQFCNVGASSHMLTSGDRIEITQPGSSAVIRTLDLSGVTVMPGLATDVYLPVAGLAPGPYTVIASFFDPGVGGVVSTRSGIQATGSLVDLHRLGRRELAPGETVELGVTMINFPTPNDTPPFYFLMLGGMPGSTPLPGGKVLPLAVDGLMRASLAGIIPGLANNIGTVPNEIPVPIFYHGTVRATMTHPAIPAASGLVLRVGVLGLDAGLTVWEASQPEEILLL